MSPYLRQVKTASGATAVQVVAKDHGVRRIVEHLGSAHDEAELAALMRLGRQRLLAGQQVLDLGPALNDDADEVGGQAPGDGGAVRRPQIISRRSGWPIEAIRSAYRRLGLGEAVGGDQAFEQMVAARLIEPTSKAESLSSFLCKRFTVGVDSVGVGGGELGQGLVPGGGDLSFDELALGPALGWWQSFLLVAFSGSFVHRCRRSPATAA